MRTIAVVLTIVNMIVALVSTVGLAYMTEKPSYLMDDLYRLKEILSANNLPPGVTTDDRRYLLDDYYYYYQRVKNIFEKSNSKEVKSALIGFASAFEELGDKPKAIKVYLRLKNEFPQNSNFADLEIYKLKMSHEKQEGIQ